jgi:hypothetical protein
MFQKGISSSSGCYAKREKLNNPDRVGSIPCCFCRLPGLGKSQRGIGGGGLVWEEVAQRFTVPVGTNSISIDFYLSRKIKAYK